MKEQRTNIDIPPTGIETPGGYLYKPPKLSKQILFLVASFFGAIVLGWIISNIPGDLSDFARAVFYIPFILVFFFGYSSWIGWLNVIVFDTIKWSMIKALFAFFVNKEKPESIQELLPTNEKMVELMVRAQKATKTFFILSWPIGIAGGIVISFLNTSTSTLLLSISVTVSTIFYGYAIYHFGRRGYIPFPEE